MQKQAAVSTAKTIGAVLAILIGCAAVVGGIGWIGVTFGVLYAAALIIAIAISFVAWVVYQDHMWHARNKATQDSLDQLIAALKQEEEHHYRTMKSIRRLRRAA